MRPLFVLLVALICLSPLGLLAAGEAWGEWGVDKIGAVVQGGKALGFVPGGMREGLGFRALMKDYAIQGLPAAAGYILSAVAGAAILIILFKLFGATRKKGRPKAKA